MGLRLRALGAPGRRREPEESATVSPPALPASLQSASTVEWSLLSQQAQRAAQQQSRSERFT